MSHNIASCFLVQSCHVHKVILGKLIEISPIITVHYLTLLFCALIHGKIDLSLFNIVNRAYYVVILIRGFLRIQILLHSQQYPDLSGILFLQAADAGFVFLGSFLRHAPALVEGGIRMS